MERARCAIGPRLSASEGRPSTNSANSSPARRPMTVSFGRARVSRSASTSSRRSPRNRLLQEVLKLHPVGNLRERIVAGEVADAALGALTVGNVAGDEDVALKLGLVRFNAR